MEAQVVLAEVAGRKEVAAFTGISVPTLARWAAEGRGPRFRKAGSRCLYLRSDVLAWIESLDSRGGQD
ncbi:helix-turn-helix transcriptional regulator [Microbacterium testaceum]|uniref:helix-turn-helix transcriptional regulator n=1 Tax=Microbacterium testaceum TaxID=2033 RepID=UPI003B43BD35